MCSMRGRRHRHGAAGQSGTYKVVWRNGQDVGAKFVSAVTQNA